MPIKKYQPEPQNKVVVPPVFLPSKEIPKEQKKLKPQQEIVELKDQLIEMISKSKFGALLIDASLETQSEYIFSHLNLQKLKSIFV